MGIQFILHMKTGFGYLLVSCKHIHGKRFRIKSTMFSLPDAVAIMSGLVSLKAWPVMYVKYLNYLKIARNALLSSFP